MRILITGGAGFVGSNLALDFKKDGAEVIVLDNLKRRGSELNLNRLKQADIPFVHGDIRFPSDIGSIGQVDLILECSAEPSVLAGVDGSPNYVLETNLVGTLHCLEWARKWKAKFLFLSTSRVYPMASLNNLNFQERENRFEWLDQQDVLGATSKGISEKFPLLGARSLYGATKLASELIIQEYVELYGLQAIVNRCGVLTGSWQMGKVDQGVVVLWVARHIYEQPLSYIGYGGTGKQVRDMLHVHDLYKLLSHQVEHFSSYNGKTYNVGGGKSRSISLRELTSLCQKYTKKEIPISPIMEDRVADLRIYITDNTSITKETGWKPEISVEEIVEEISEWILENKKQLEPILA